MDTNQIIQNLAAAAQKRAVAQAEFSAALAVARAFQKGKLFTAEQSAQVEKIAPTKQRTKKGKTA